MEAIRFNCSWAWTRLTVAMASLEEDSSSTTSTSTVQRRAAFASVSESSIRDAASSHHTDTRPMHQFEIEEPPSPSPSTPDADDSRANAAENETVYPGGCALWLTLMAMGLNIAVIGLDSSILATAVPAITDDFGTIADVGWYSAAFKLSRCAFQFMFGRMYQVWGIRRVFLASMLILLPGSLMCALAPSSKAFVVARAVQGLGSTGVVAGCYTTVAEMLPVRKRPVVMGALAFAEAVSTAIAPVIGGILTTKVGWRWCFWINIPILVPVLLVTALSLHQPRPARYQHLPWREKIEKLDLTGTILIVPAITALLIGLQYGGTTYGWTDPRIMSCFSVSALLIGVFSWWQYHMQDAATLPPRIIKRRSIIAGMIFAGCNSSSIGIVTYYLPIYFQTVMQLSAQQSGLRTLPYVFSFMFSILSGGAITQAIGYWVVPMMVTSLLTPVAIGNLSTLSVSPASAALVGWQMLLGFAGGLGFQGPAVAVSSLLDPDDVSFGIACIQFGQNFLPAVSIPAAQTIFKQRLLLDLSQTAPGAFNVSAIANIGLSDLRAQVRAGQLGGTLLGFDRALMSTFYLPTALACATVLGTLAIEWKSIKKVSPAR